MRVWKAGTICPPLTRVSIPLRKFLRRPDYVKAISGGYGFHPSKEVFEAKQVDLTDVPEVGVSIPLRKFLREDIDAVREVLGLEFPSL